MKRSEFPPTDDHEEPQMERELERDEARKLGELLRRYSTQPRRDFEGFNAGVMGRIAAETPALPPSPVVVQFAPLRRLVWGGLGGLATAALLFLALVRPVLHQPGPPPEYYAQVLKATTSDPAISAVAVHSPHDGVTVLWIEGLDYVPAQKAKN